MPPATSPVAGRARRGSRHPRLRKALLVLVLLAGTGGATLHFFGDTLVPPLVDAVRGVIGPAAMADLEAQYYDAVETTHQWQRTLGLAPPVTAPWAAPPVATARPAPIVPPTGPGARALPPLLATPPEELLPPAEVAGTGALPADEGSSVLPSPLATQPEEIPLPTKPSGRALADLSPTVPVPTGSDPRLVAPGARVRSDPTPGSPLVTVRPLPLRPLLTDGSLAGEGRWSNADLPAPPQGAPPVFWKTFLRPDPARPDVLVYLVRFDPRHVRLHLVAGRKEPVSPTAIHSLGEVAPADLPNLIAAFNGGFKSINGHYGMMVGGLVIAPPNPKGDTATLAVHADGRVELGAWQTVGIAPDLVSYRQNCPLLIDQGAVVVQNHSDIAWGLSALNAMYVWRSGLGRTADGTLIYAAGNRLSANELAQALQQAGAVEAMQLDINSAWVHWLNYTRDTPGTLHPVPLVHGMTYHANQYLTPGDRDFFYLTWP